MEFITFSYDQQNFVSTGEREIFSKKLAPEIKRIAEIIGKGYDTDYGSINLPFDREMLAVTQDCIQKKKHLEPSALVLIGIGGSNLGTLAVHQALHGIYNNELKSTIKVYSADTVDARTMADSIQLVTQLLDAGQQVLINVVTKSGTTIETLVNFARFLDVLIAKRPSDYNKFIVVTTDAESPLETFARKKQIDVLQVPIKVGGRFSVFSPVGLFPLGILGVDLEQVLSGARDAIKLCTSPEIMHNPAALQAILKYALYKKDVTTHNLFAFSTALEAMGKWYRQLMGESIAKEYNLKGERVEIGITPTVSIGTTDLHSVAQLYLGGPRNTFTTFISLKEDTYPTNPRLLRELGIKFIAQDTDNTVVIPIMNAILEGVKRAYTKNKRPYCSMVLPALSSYYMGQLLQLSMLEIMYLGYLFEINPFDQPAVELYKKEALLRLKELTL